MIYYSKLQNTFFDDNIHTAEQIEAAEGIEITQEKYLELLNALNSGCIVLDDLSLSPPRPSAAHEWSGKEWVISQEKAAQIKAENQAAMWEQIKQKRHQNTRNGVYVASVKKWFHTDDSSRTQYLQLQILAAAGKLPEKLAWKTMDNSFINMTAEVLSAVAAQIVVNEQLDFTNAEKHRAAMLKADNPLEYDYSGGWTAVFNAEQ